MLLAVFRVTTSSFEVISTSVSPRDLKMSNNFLPGNVIEKSSDMFALKALEICTSRSVAVRDISPDWPEIRTCPSIGMVCFLSTTPTALERCETNSSELIIIFIFYLLIIISVVNMLVIM